MFSTSRRIEELSKLFKKFLSLIFNSKTEEKNVCSVSQKNGTERDDRLDGLEEIDSSEDEGSRPEVEKEGVQDERRLEASRVNVHVQPIQEESELDAYDYELPERLIAQSPLPDRASARLMVVDRSTQTISHMHVRDIAQFPSGRRRGS